MLNSCVMHRPTGPAPGIMVWGGIGYHSRTPLVRIAGTLNSQRCFSEVLEPQLSFLTFRAWTQQYFKRITPPAASPDQLWQRVEAAWSAVPQEHIRNLFESMPRRVAVVISNNCGYSGY
ncbi:transposable element Tcb1 transposase [Trichonephila clavipes]|nr:transposable element Tcb1 transposase [Trichonephila clavipes]